MNAPSPWWLLSAVLGDRDILDVPVSLSSGDVIENLRIVMTETVSGIEGRVVDAAGRPQSGLDVVIFPQDRRLWANGSRRVRMTQPDLDGMYRVRELPPGDYLVAVNVDIALDPTLNADDLNRVVAVARPVRVQLGEVVQVNLAPK